MTANRSTPRGGGAVYNLEAKHFKTNGEIPWKLQVGNRGGRSICSSLISQGSTNVKGLIIRRKVLSIFYLSIIKPLANSVMSIKGHFKELLYFDAIIKERLLVLWHVTKLEC